jgi:hypothetical protein
MLMSKTSVMALNKRLKKDIATEELYRKLQTKRKEVRREYQNRPFSLTNPDDNIYSTDKILNQAMTIMNEAKDKSRDIEDQLSSLESKWRFRDNMEK